MSFSFLVPCGILCFDWPATIIARFIGFATVRAFLDWPATVRTFLDWLATHSNPQQPTATLKASSLLCRGKWTSGKWVVGNKPRKLQRGCLNCRSPLPLARNIASEYRFQGTEVAENEIEREGGGGGVIPYLT